MSDYLTGTDQIMANRTKYSTYFEKKDSANDLSMDSFLNLLIAEMTNQNPLEPMNNSEFVSQMAQFTSLSAMQDMVKSSNASYASSLIGKNVTISSSTEYGVFETTGTVTGINMKNNNYYVIVDDREYNVSSITKIGTGEVADSNNDNNNSFSYATSLIGKYGVMKVIENGETLYVHGKISSAEMIDGKAMVVIDEIAFPMNDIVKISDEPIEFTDEDSSENDTDETTDL